MRPHLLLCFLLACLAPVAHALDLEPFHIQYRLYVSKIPTTIKADLTLERTGQPDEFKMALAVKSFLVSNLETSTFTWNDCEPRPQHYTHRFRGFGRKRGYDMRFDWSDPPKAITEDSTEDKEYVLSIKQDTLDDLTLLLKARCILASGDKEFHATSAYGDSLRVQHMQVIGRETLDTPIGKLDCLIIEKKRKKESQRHTLFWVAPSLDYQLVKAKHIENRALFGELIMRDYEGPRPEKAADTGEETAAKE